MCTLTNPHKGASATPRRNKNRWDETPTPGHALDTAETPRRANWDETPRSKGAWEETPKKPVSGETPTPKKTRSRWDETPVNVGAGNYNLLTYILPLLTTYLPTTDLPT